MGGLLLAALATSNTSAQGAKLSIGPEIATDNPWLTCTGAAPERYYPRAAQKASIEGAARVQCRLKPDGRMSACTWLEETPTGYDFGETAAKLGCMMKMRPPQADNRIEAPSGSATQFPLRFTLPK